jgi:phenylpyruvate tautomerase PptA (4-oxalocrotonate tautomerase family)
MPIVDVELICKSEAEFAQASVEALADTLGQAFGSEPGHTWVRLRFLGVASYAENRCAAEHAEPPVFISVLHAHPPKGEALANEAMAVTQAVAQCLGRPLERVHVQYAPGGAGRQAFGGRLVQ